jgi:uncharacterized membrane protein
MALPGARVDRKSFLYSQLVNYCGQEQTLRSIETRPAIAGVPSDVIDRLADSCIKGHVLKASSISFAAGLPGGWTMVGTIPADLAQFYWHALVLAQKLAYLYGWPDLLDGGEVDEQTELLLTLLIGAMMGAQAAQRGLAELARRFAQEVVRRLPRVALTKYAMYNLAKQVARWIGVSITKASFARGISKVIPLVGGVMSAGVTAGMMFPMAKRLKNHLKGLQFAKLGDNTAGSESRVA